MNETERMTPSRWRTTRTAAMVLAAAALWVGARAAVEAAGVPGTLRRSFAFPASLATGMTSDLTSPAGTASTLTFERGMVAVGYLPIPRPQSLSRRRRALSRREFVRSTDAAPHARLLLSGVMNGDGSPTTNTGNQLVIDALVSPSAAALEPPPFVIPFDIQSGTAFVDLPLPVTGQGDGPVRLQVLGVTVLDPAGQPFAVLGFAMPISQQTPQPTATPGGPVQPLGQCMVGSNCRGPSFAASQERCCGFSRPLPGRPPSIPVSWCPPDQYDATTGQCAAAACAACPSPTPAACEDRLACAGECVVQCPDGHSEAGTCAAGATCQCQANCEAAPTPTPAQCADAANCAGACMATCADGTTVAGQCAVGQDRQCSCSAVCVEPTPCSVGQCFDTVGFRCTGEACGPGLHCPLPNQFCDVSGRHCPCSLPPPPAPTGQVCCQCKDRVPACFTLSFVEVAPSCPPGCDTFPQETCDPQTNGCVAAAPCSTDADCDDGNGCTIDRCSAGVCTHDCVCVGPVGCGPGPGAR